MAAPAPSTAPLSKIIRAPLRPSSAWRLSPRYRATRLLGSLGRRLTLLLSRSHTPVQLPVLLHAYSFPMRLDTSPAPHARARGSHHLTTLPGIPTSWESVVDDVFYTSTTTATTSTPTTTTTIIQSTLYHIISNVRHILPGSSIHVYCAIHQSINQSILALAGFPQLIHLCFPVMISSPAHWRT